MVRSCGPLMKSTNRRTFSLVTAHGSSPGKRPQLPKMTNDSGGENATVQ
jgi:hypothetical protein